MARAKSPRVYNPDRFDEEYYERGAVTGISGYRDYSWMPELSIKMAHFMINHLPIQEHETVLDFGCAKGYLVRALRILEIAAYGVDVSKYAIDQTPPDVRHCCDHVEGCHDPRLFARHYNWMVSKDVFEHVPEPELRVLLENAYKHVDKIYTIIPLGKDNVSNRFVVPSYDHDVTHITVKTKTWWANLFREHGWETVSFNYSLRGVKDQWTGAYSKGNGFFLLNKI